MRHLYLIIFVSFLTIQAKSQSLEITFTTKVVTQSGASKYSPKHVLAVWVETSTGSFVSSVEVMAKERIGYLSAWSAKSKNNKVNAITGATLNSHVQQTITWNCLKYDGTIVAAGDYVLWIEETSGDATGPKSPVAFTIGNESYTSTPIDGTTFTGMTLKYTAPVTGIEPKNSSNQNVVAAFPNPFRESTNISIYMPATTQGKLTIVNLLGQVVFSAKLDESVFNDQLYIWNGSDNNGKFLPAGTYFCLIETASYKTSYKLMKQ